MDINRRTVAIGFCIIFLVWITNIIYFQRQQLAEPLVMKHYYELDYRDRVNFDIYYLVNRSDDTYLVQGNLPEGLSIGFNILNNQEATYTHHILKRATIEMYGDDIEELLDAGEYSFKQLELYFSNGLTRSVDIGEIFVFKRKDEIREDRPLHFTSGGGSSNNTGYTLLSAAKSVELNSLDYQWREELKDFFYLEIDTSQETLTDLADSQRVEGRFHEEGTQEEIEEYVENSRRLREGLFSMGGEGVPEGLLQIKLEAGDYIKINNRFDVDKKDNRYRNYYLFNIQLTGETLDNEEFQNLNYVNYRPHFSNADIRQIVREKRGK